MRQALVAFAISKRKMLKAELPAVAKTATPHAVRRCRTRPRNKRSVAVRSIVEVTGQARAARVACCPVAVLIGVQASPSRTARSRSASRKRLCQPTAPAFLEKLLGIGAGDVAGYENDPPRAASALV